MKLALKWGVSLVIAGLFVWLSFRQWPVDRVLCSSVGWEGGRLECLSGGTLSWSLSPGWLLLSVLVLVLVHFLRVIRWRPLVEPLAHFDFWTLNRVCAMSFLAIFVFPLRLGELARPVLIAQTGKIRKSAAFGTIAVERVVDGVMMALLLWLVLLSVPAADPAVYWSLRTGAWVAFLVFGGALGLLLLAYWRRRLAVRLVDLFLGRVSQRLSVRISGMMEAFIEGMRAMPSVGTGVRFVLYTALYWGLNGFYYYALVVAFGLDGQVTLAGAYAMMAAVAVGMMIPNSPANVGSFWYFLLMPATLYGVGTDSGGPMAFALTVWGLMLLQYLVFAGYYVVRQGDSLGALWSLQKQPASGKPV